MKYDMKDNIEGFSDLSKHGGQKTLKREIWDWSAIGRMGEFRMVSKHDLYIDTQYQREQTSVDKVTKIASKWDWRLFGALSVMKDKESGVLKIYDGGHRWRASKYRDDIDKLPCMIFEGGDLAEQSKAFVGANTMKSNVSAVDHFKAAVVAGEPIACVTKRILDKYGYKVVKGGREHMSISAIGTFKQLVSENEERAERAFLLSSEICSGGKLIQGGILRAIFHISKQLPEIFINPIRKKLILLGDEPILIAMQRKKALVGEGGYKVEAQAIVDLINKNRRQKLILE